MYYDIGQQDSAAFSFDGLNVKISYTSQDGIRYGHMASNIIELTSKTKAVVSYDIKHSRWLRCVPLTCF